MWLFFLFCFVLQRLLFANHLTPTGYRRNLLRGLRFFSIQGIIIIPSHTSGQRCFAVYPHGGFLAATDLHLKSCKVEFITCHSERNKRKNPGQNLWSDPSFNQSSSALKTSVSQMLKVSKIVCGLQVEQHRSLVACWCSFNSRVKYCSIYIFLQHNLTLQQSTANKTRKKCSSLHLQVALTCAQQVVSFLEKDLIKLILSRRTKTSGAPDFWWQLCQHTPKVVAALLPPPQP